MAPIQYDANKEERNPGQAQSPLQRFHTLLKLLSLLPDLPSFSPPPSPSLPPSLAHSLYVLRCIIAECFSYLSWSKDQRLSCRNPSLLPVSFSSRLLSPCFNFIPLDIKSDIGIGTGLNNTMPNPPVNNQSELQTRAIGRRGRIASLIRCCPPPLLISLFDEYVLRTS